RLNQAVPAEEKAACKIFHRHRHRDHHRGRSKKRRAKRGSLLILLLPRPVDRADEEGPQRSKKALHSRTVAHPLRRVGVGAGGLGEIRRGPFDKLRTRHSTSSGRDEAGGLGGGTERKVTTWRTVRRRCADVPLV